MRVLLSPDGQSWEGQFGAGTLRVYGNRGDESLMVKSLGGGRLAAPPEAGSALHLVWVNETEGFLQVVLATSADGGRSWREPVLVNDGGRGSNHSNPAIAVNGAGHVAVMWNDRRDDPSDRCFRPYVSVSLDAARSFLAGVPLEGHPVCPPPGRWLNGGDTQGLVALPDGSFQALWIGAGGDGGRALQLWTSRITVHQH